MPPRVFSLELVAQNMCGSSRHPYWDVCTSRKQVLYLCTMTSWFSFFSLLSQTVNLQFLLYQGRPSWLLNIKTPTSSISSLIYGSQLYLARSWAQVNPRVRVLLSSQAAEQCRRKMTKLYSLVPLQSPGFQLELGFQNYFIILYLLIVSFLFHFPVSIHHAILQLVTYLLLFILNS